MTTSIIKNSNLKNLRKNLKQYESFKSKIFHSKSDTPLSGDEIITFRERNSVDSKVLADLFTNSIGNRATAIKKIDVKSTFHTLYKVRASKQEYIIKINTLNDYYHDFTFYQESLLQEKLKKNGIANVPVFDIDLSREKYQFDYMIMLYAKGENLESYSGKNQADIYFDLGRTFKKIHKIKTSGVGHLDMPVLLKDKKIQGKFKSWNNFFLIKLQEHVDRVLKIGIITKKEKELIEKKFNENYNLLKKTDLALLHNDPGTRNIITNGRSVVAIIDWEDAIVGDPLWDIAFMDTFLFRKKDKIKFENFCNGYGLGQEALSSVKYSIYYLRIALIKTISRFMSGVYDKKGMQIDRLRINNVLKKLKKL